MIAWTKPFEVAYQHRAGLAETAYKKLRLIWNSSLSRKKKLHIFQSTFLPNLTYGLDALTLTDKFLARIDAYYIRFLRRIVNIKASYYFRITNHTVWRVAGYPKKPSFFLKRSQTKLLEEEFFTDPEEPIHHVVFCNAYKDRIITTGRRRGMQFPYFIETTTRRQLPNRWIDHPGRGIFGPNDVYVAINRDLKHSSEHASMRASRQRCARP